MEAVRRISDATKAPIDRKPESPLVLVGHSMGALVLEAAFLKLLSEDDPSFIRPAHAPQDQQPVNLLMDGRPILMPDLILAINSAAESNTSRRREEAAQAPEDH